VALVMHLAMTHDSHKDRQDRNSGMALDRL